MNHKPSKKILEDFVKRDGVDCMDISYALNGERMAVVGKIFDTADGRMRDYIFRFEDSQWVASWYDDAKTAWMLLATPCREVGQDDD